MGNIDLHLHTTASDGVMTPSEIVNYAKNKGLLAIAITDHDTIEGLEEGLAEGQRIGLEVIPGIEISAEHSPGSMHLLGFFIDIHHPILKERLEFLQRARAERNPRMVEKLNKLGIDITFDEVLKASGGGQVGRPHFAQLLLKKGYVRSFQEAFDRFLGKGAAAYVEKMRFSPEESIHFINEANGVAVLAHPNTLQLNGYPELENLILRLVKRGLRGIEAYYPEHTQSMINFYLRLADKYNLVVTGGSDCHGNANPGVVVGQAKIPYELVESLKDAQRNKL